MKWIKYEIYQNTINTGTESNPVYEDILLKKKIAYCEENLAIAKKEAYNGDYTIEEDDDIEVEPQSIELGGTGAKDAEGARNNLNVYSKDESCTKDTLSLFGLGENHSPNNILSMIGKYWWRRKAIEEGYGLFKVYNEVTNERRFDSNSPLKIYFSNEVEVTKDGITLVNYQYKRLNSSDFKSGYDMGLDNIIEGKYFAINSGYVNLSEVYCKSEVRKIQGNYVSPFFTLFYVDVCTARYYENSSEYEYLSSVHKDAHPVGKDGMFVYEFLGKPFDNARSGARILFGSYIGAGTYGKNNPNRLVFDFEPKLVFVAGEFVMMKPNDKWSTFGDALWGNVEWTENSVLWYDNSNTYNQRNVLNKEYFYVALG